MSSKSLWQETLSSILKSPYAFLAYMGVGFSVISQFSREQRENIFEFLRLLDNLPGYLFLSMIIIVLFYGLFFFPIGKFFGKSLVSIYADVNQHSRESAAHFAEHKLLIEHMGTLVESVTIIADDMEKMNEMANDIHTLVQKFEG